MTEGQANGALEKLNQGIEESRRMVQERTMELARDYFTDSMETLRQEIENSRSTLESLPEQIPGGQEESFQVLFQELMDNYELVEDSIGKAQKNVSGLDPEQIRQQGELNASDAARREAQELGVDLTEVEGTGTGGRIIVSDVVEAAQEKTRRKAVELGVDLSQIEGTGSGGLKTVEDVIEASGQAGEQAADLTGQTAQETQEVAGEATEQAGGAAQEAVGQVVQGAGDGVEQALGQAGQAVQSVDGAADGAADQLLDQTAETTNGAGAKQARATTAARRKAEELGVDLSQVEGSGSGGLITIKDVTTFQG